MLRIFGYSFSPEGEYGVCCGVVIAENTEEAATLIASQGNRVDYTLEDVQNVLNGYKFKEIPYQKGDFYIASYFE